MRVPALMLEDCRYSRPALSLGCSILDTDVDGSVCAPALAALDSCRAQRDCPAGGVCR